MVPADGAPKLNVLSATKPKLRAAFMANFETWYCAVQSLVDDELSACRRRLEEEMAQRQQAMDQEWEKRLRELRGEQDRLKAWTQELEERQARFDREKSAMMGCARPEDVLDLNVGGLADCAASRRTLCCVEDSMLAARFSGRWDDSLEKDSRGRFFVDFSPDLFLPLLDFLRQREVATVADPARSPAVPESQMPDFVSMVRYYGLLDAVYPMSIELHRGQRAHVELKHRAQRVSTTMWATFILRGAVVCNEFEIAIESLQNPQIGWATADFQEKLEVPCNAGAGDDEHSWGLDGTRHVVWHKGVEKHVNVSWGSGASVRCALDHKERKMRWFVDGVEVPECETDLPRTRLFPVVTGRGTWALKSWSC